MFFDTKIDVFYKTRLLKSRCVDSMVFESIFNIFIGFANGETFVIKALFSPEGDYIISGSEDSSIYCWKTKLDNDKIGRPDRNGYCQSIKVSSNSKLKNSW